MKRLLAFIAAIALTLGLAGTPTHAAPHRPNHTDWSTPFNICQLYNVAYFENPTGVNYNIYRANDFNFFGHFGVSCTIYRAAYIASPPGPYGWVCYVYDRETHKVYWISCPAP